MQAGVQIIMDTQPKGAGGGGGLSREEIVDRICEDLLSKVCSDTFFYNSFHLLFIFSLCWQTCTHYIWQYQWCVLQTTATVLVLSAALYSQPTSESFFCSMHAMM